jgi:hypothetical protein
MKTIRSEKLKKIERILKSDIKWAAEHNIKFDGNQGPSLRGETWGVKKQCGTCAIGAYCVRRQPILDDGIIPYAPAIFAREVGVPDAWAADLYIAVAHAGSLFNPLFWLSDRDCFNEDAPPQVVSLAKRLVKYGYNQNKKNRKTK